MTVDIEKARALVERLRLVDISWSDDGEAAAEAADLIAALLEERDALMSLIRDEIDENRRLRVLGGAAADEGITAMLERVIAERDALITDQQRSAPARREDMQSFAEYLRQHPDEARKFFKSAGVDEIVKAARGAE